MLRGAGVFVLLGTARLVQGTTALRGAASALSTDSVVSRDESDSPPLSISSPVVVLSMQKAGTSSLKEFARSMLGLRTLHNFAAVQWATMFDDFKCDPTEGPTAPFFTPAYEQWLAALGEENMRRILSHGQYDVFMDTPFYSLPLDFYESVLPNARYVLWARNSTDWTQSMLKYFGDAGPMREFQLSYGHCNITREALPDFQRSYEAHIHRTRAYFASPRRAARFLDLDVLASDAGITFCEFVAVNPSDCAARLGNMTGIPDFSPDMYDVTEFPKHDFKNLKLAVRTPCAKGRER